MQEDFDQIYQNYFDPVYRYVLSISENSAVAEEITQETFFKALQSLDQFQGKSNLKSWLCAIAKNQWLLEQRKKNVQPVDEVTSLADPQLSFRDIGELFDKSENWACVVYHRARAKLKEKMEG